jgi:dTDP-4-dehydrorhamnose reductase
MNPPRILLIGRIGQVGWELRRTLAPLGQLVCVDYPEIDLTDGHSIARWVEEAAPQVIINAAAYTAVDKAEAEPDLALQINGTAPGLLAELARQRQALLIHYSTDYVFDGSKASSYTEDDPPNPQSAYGRSKLAGDRAIQQVDCAHLIFRLCWVYGARGQNFLRTMLRLAREREQVRVVWDQVGCPTWSRIIAETTALALQRVWASEDFAPWKGVYHLAAAGQTSWHGFAERIVAQIPASQRRCQRVEAITTPEYPTPARRPAYSVLGCAKLERTFGLRPPDWEEQLRLVVDPGETEGKEDN